MCYNLGQYVLVMWGRNSRGPIEGFAGRCNMITDWNKTASLNMQIVRRYDNLTKMERKVAAVVAQLGEALVGYSISDLAVECQVSEPTVIRFCRSMGFQGIKELKKAAVRVEPPLALSKNITRMEQVGSDEDMVAFVFDGIVGVLRETRKILDIESLNMAASFLARAKYVKVVGFGGSAIIARHAQHYLRMSGMHVDMVNNYLPNDPIFENYSEGDVVLAISFSGNTSMVVDIARDAKRKGATVIGLTAWGENKIQALADVTLQCVLSGSCIIPGTNAVERMSLIALVDVLLAGVYRSKAKQADPTI